MDYATYQQLIEKLQAEGKTTGLDQSAEHVEYTKLNFQRMARIEKTAVLGAEILSALNGLKGRYTWLVITESWCGDAAQNLPLFYLISKACPAITLKLVLRDENPELMNNYLTNGSRSIPKLICVESESLKELFTWGPRPAVLQTMVLELIAQHVPKPERGVITQKWYNQDKTQSLQAELMGLMKTYLV
jgi:hypothetical protein